MSARLAGIAQYGLLGLFLAFVCAPMLVVVVFSFDANRFPTIPWGGFSLQWHRAIFEDGQVTQAFYNSAIVALGTAALSTILGFAAAYIDYRYMFRGKRLFVLLVAVPPAVPATILGMAMLAFELIFGVLIILAVGRKMPPRRVLAQPRI